MKYLISLFVALFCLTSTYGQKLDMLSKTNIILKDGTNVVLYGSKNGMKGKWPFEAKKANCEKQSNKMLAMKLPNNWQKNAVQMRKKKEIPRYRDYYYLPPNETVRMPVKDGKPVFSFIVFQQDEGNVKGQESLGILTFDLIFGLSKAQESELAAAVKKMDPGAKVKGQVNLRPSELGGGIRFISSTVDTLIKCSILPPRHPGEPFSASVKLSGEEAAMLRAYMEDPRVNDVDLKIEFAYNVAMTVPGVKAGLYINKCKFQEFKETITEGGKTERESGFVSFAKGLFGKKAEHTNEKTEGYALYEKLVEDEVVNFNIELGEYLPESMRSTIIESFFEMFIEQTSEPITDPQAINDIEQNLPASTKVRLGKTYYKFSKTRMENYSQEQSKTVEINLDMNILEPVIIRCSFGHQLRDACQNLGQSCPLAVNLSEWKVSEKKELVFNLSQSLRGYLDDGLIDAVRISVRKKRRKKDYEKVMQISSSDSESTLSFTYVNNTDDISNEITIQKEFCINDKYYTLENSKYSDSGKPENIGLPASLLTIRSVVDGDARKYIDTMGIKGVEIELRYKTIEGEKSAELNLYDIDQDQFASQERSMLISSKMKKLTYRYKVISKNAPGELVTPWYTRTLSDGEIEGPITKDIYVSIDLSQCEGCFDKGSKNFLEAVKRAGLNVSDILDEFGDLKAGLAKTWGQYKDKF